MTNGECIQTGDTLQNFQKLETFKNKLITTFTRNAMVTNNVEAPNIPTGYINSPVDEEKNKTLCAKKDCKGIGQDGYQWKFIVRYLESS